jgi:hypothetical protein
MKKIRGRAQNGLHGNFLETMGQNQNISNTFSRKYMFGHDMGLNGFRSH